MTLSSIKRFLRDEGGPTAVEYAVMLMLIVTFCIGSIQFLANALKGSMDSSGNSIGGYLT